MKRRARFLLHGNFQLAFLMGLSAIAALGLLGAALLNYLTLEPIVEEAAFAAHLSSASSAELIWRAVAAVSLLTAAASLLIGCGAILGALCYLERFFRVLSEGLVRLAGGQRACRLRVGLAWGAGLLREFNAAAASLERRDQEALALLHALIALTDSTEPDWLARTHDLQRAVRRLYS